MTQNQTKKEALFNEVKGSLFEYLVAREIAILGNEELGFQKSLDPNYLNVLSQQDRMVRQFYPEMLPFLVEASKLTAQHIINYFNEIPTGPKVVGKFSNSSISSELHEADMLLSLRDVICPVSLKMNKKNAFVNTKSGGVKSFFSQYFPFLDSGVQREFNKFIDLEFHRLAVELHDLHGMDYPGHFNLWISRGLSELPGELDPDSRKILKSYYSRIAEKMHSILGPALNAHFERFKDALPSLLGFGSKNILQVIYFHTFPLNKNPLIEIHSHQDVLSQLDKALLRPFGSVSSLEFEIGEWILQIRVKPMNKFTTTAIKINCSVKVRRSILF